MYISPMLQLQNRRAGACPRHIAANAPPPPRRRQRTAANAPPPPRARRIAQPRLNNILLIVCTMSFMSSSSE